ncbi:hypothetical protein DYB32_002151 [Aphanomyces invadans]|uniref:Rab-GAP TBC domain-containing protein n=1 Tax=Aphanomyces invadans TaxID=157072 RepID=A0A3R6Z310_9STRA|nr:hypothetical protein DYB32_002151 [Aphanomyces invadans]
MSISQVTVLAHLRSRYTALLANLERAITAQERIRTVPLGNAREESLCIGIELDQTNQTVHEELRRLAKTTGHLSCGLLPFFSFLGPLDVVAALSVCRSWHSTLSSYCILSQSFGQPEDRWRYWQPHLLPHTFTPQSLSSPKAASSCDTSHGSPVGITSHLDDELLHQEVHRTTFFPKESMYMPSLLSSPTSSPSPSPTAATTLPRIGSYSSKSPALKSLHTKLHLLLATFAHQYPNVGYGHGMTFLGAALLSTLQYDVDATFHVFCTLMQKHGMHYLWHGSPSSFGAGLPRRLHQLEHCLDMYAPAVTSHLRTHHVTPSMFASSWILSLFLNDRSLPPSTCMHILDTFLVEGWLAMYALYVGLILVHARELLDATDDAAILHALLSLPKHLATRGLGPYRHRAFTTLTPPLATSLSMEVEREPHP